MRSVSYWGRPRWAYGSSGSSQLIRWVCAPLTNTMFPVSQIPASIASRTMPWSAQISMVRQWMPIALSAWTGGVARFSITRQSMPRRASSTAAVSPVGPAPTMSTSVVVCTSVSLPVLGSRRVLG